MADQKFDPVKEFVSLRDNLTRTVGQGLKNVAGIEVPFPAVDVYETDETVIIVTEPLLGADASSIEVSMEDDILLIKGKSVSPFDVEETAYLHRELRFGEFKREIRIPRKVQSTAAAASFKQGILTITLPKVEETSSQIIGITPAE